MATSIFGKNDLFPSSEEGVEDEGVGVSDDMYDDIEANAKELLLLLRDIPMLAPLLVPFQTI